MKIIDLKEVTSDVTDKKLYYGSIDLCLGNKVCFIMSEKNRRVLAYQYCSDFFDNMDALLYSKKGESDYDAARDILAADRIGNIEPYEKIEELVKKFSTMTSFLSPTVVEEF